MTVSGTCSSPAGDRSQRDAPAAGWQAAASSDSGSGNRRGAAASIGEPDLDRGQALAALGDPRLDPLPRLQVGNPAPAHGFHVQEDVRRTSSALVPRRD